MSREVRAQKLDSIARCLERLNEKTPSNVDELVRNTDLQDIVMINLERLVQLCVDVGTLLISEKSWQPMPTTMAGVFDILHSQGILTDALQLRMKKSVGFRNLAVHEYDKINWSIVYKILTEHLNDFRQFARIVDAVD